MPRLLDPLAHRIEEVDAVNGPQVRPEPAHPDGESQIREPVSEKSERVEVPRRALGKDLGRPRVPGESGEDPRVPSGPLDLLERYCPAAEPIP